MMKTLSHHQVQSLYLSDELINEDERVALEAHLGSCHECKAVVDLIERLEAGEWSPYSKPSLSQSEKRQITHTLKSQVRRRKKFSHLLHPFQAAAWASLAVVFVLVMIWTFNNLVPQPAATLPAVVDAQPTSTATETLILQPTLTGTLTPTPTPTPATPIPTVPTATADPTLDPTTSVGAGVQVESGFWYRTETIEKDMNCDGREERLHLSYRIPIPYGNNLPIKDYLGVVLEENTDSGVYELVWEYDLFHEVNKGLFEVEVIAVDGCEQLLAVTGMEWARTSYRYRDVLRVYRWDGEQMSLVLDAPAAALDDDKYELNISGQERDPSKPFTITTFTYGAPDPVKGVCDWTYTVYAWNGEIFEQIDQWVESGRHCGGDGG